VGRGNKGRQLPLTDACQNASMVGAVVFVLCPGFNQAKSMLQLKIVLTALLSVRELSV
jgi:hypothetical protein